MLRTGSGYNRFNARVNVKKWLTVGANVSFARTKRLTEDGQFSDWVGAPPLAQPYLPDGSLRDWMNAEDLNPLYLQAHNNGEEVSELGRYTGYVEIRPFKGFSYRLNASYSARNQERGGYTDRQYPSVGSMASLQYGNYRRELIDNIINYQVPFNNEDHNLLLTGVSSYDNLRNTGLGLAASDISVDRDWNMIADGEFSDAWRGPTSNEDDDYGYDENLVLAFIGRLNYSYKDRYLLQASIARNGSSRFGQNNKWASLPSVSAGWRISEENFMQNVKAVDNLKLRLSYGQVGNQGGIPGFTTTPLANSKPMEFGDLPVMGYLPGEVMVNPFLKWETSITWNVGVDFSLFDSRLNGTVELYNTNTEDLLVERQIVSSLGYSKMWDNLGLSRTQGYEVSLAYDIFRKTDFRWSVSTNVGFSRNKIIRIDDGVDANGNPLPDEANNWFPGHPIKVYRDYYFDGIYQLDDFLDLGNGQWEMLHDIDTDGDGYGDTHVIPYQTNPAPGMIRVRDRDGNGKIDTDDRYIRPTEPTLIYAFTTNMQWKGFDLMADFYGTGGSLTRNPLLNTTANGTLRGRYNGIKVDYWTPENPSNRWPRPNALQNPSLNGSAAIQDSDYIRLRTLALGYTLPSNLTEKLEIDMVRVSVTATNLWTKTDFLSYSPEYSASGYPEPRQFIFGLNVTF
jgi:TonB-linked SusC/RagA family outer membrane protein